MKLLLDHDGAVDDLLSLTMVLAMGHVDLQGIVVTPADCYLRPAVSATCKILRLLGRSDINVSGGNLHGVHTFPSEWRKPAYHVDALPVLNDQDGDLPPAVAEPGHQFLARKLAEASEPVVVLVTGPITNLAAALAGQPSLREKIQEVVWMGGALNVPGNVLDYDHDGSAEWNAYWDPPSTRKLFELDLAVTLFPLDITNDVPVTMDFLHRLARQRRHRLSDLAGQCWAMTVGTIPAYEYRYYMWDTLATGYLGAPDLYSLRQSRCQVVDSGASAGRIREVQSGGHAIRVADHVDVEGFFDFVLELFGQ